jgi:hypothetical protein
MMVEYTGLESYYQNELSAPVAGSQSGKHTMRIKQDMKEIDKRSDCVFTASYFL